MTGLKILIAVASMTASANIILPIANVVAQNGTIIEAIGKSGAVGILACAMYKLIDRMMKDHEKREERHLALIEKIDKSSAAREDNLQDTIRVLSKTVNNYSDKPCVSGEREAK